MKSRLFQWFAIVLVVVIGVIHIINAQAEYDEAAYMGYLFAANFFGALVAAWAIYHRQVWGWFLGIVIALGSIAGYSWSRTLGMPGMNIEEWLTPYGIVSLVVEGAFLALAAFRPWKFSIDEPKAWSGSKIRYAFPVVSLILVAAISFGTIQWDYQVTQDFGHHVASLEKICRTPLTTAAELEEKYGVQVSLVAASMLNSIVDVRLKIVDPEKAHLFLLNQAALLFNQEALILAPHMHSHAGPRLKAGKVVSVFFPTEQKIHSGSEVSLVFGSIRIEPMNVQ